MMLSAHKHPLCYRPHDWNKWHHLISSFSLLPLQAGWRASRERLGKAQMKRVGRRKHIEASPCCFTLSYYWLNNCAVSARISGRNNQVWNKPTEMPQLLKMWVNPWGSKEHALVLYPPQNSRQSLQSPPLSRETCSVAAHCKWEKENTTKKWHTSSWYLTLLLPSSWKTFCQQNDVRKRQVKDNANKTMHRH